MNPVELFQVASQALGVFLVLAGLWFASSQFWPWWVERDKVERERKHELHRAQNGISEAIASHLAVIAFRLTNPISIVLDDDLKPD